MKTVAIIADDHTGAADSAIHFARMGGETALLLELSELTCKLAKMDAVALTTESRFMDAEQAAKEVKKAVRLCRDAGIDRFFKKIDSTMRGNPGGEIVAALEATGCEAALVCTAMPNAGRTCVDGVIQLDNVPLHTTRSGHDPFHPLTTSVVADLLAEQCDLKTGALRLRELRDPLKNVLQRIRGLIDDGCKLIIADAGDEADLRILGELFPKMPDLLPAGAAGLAAAMAQAGSCGTREETITEQPVGRILGVVGSLSPVSREQADLACRQGDFDSIELEPQAACTNLEAECSRIVREAASNTSEHLLLRTLESDNQDTKSGATGELIAGFLGKITRELFRQTAYDIIFATGGNTAMAVARSMGIKSITLQQELMPGVVLGVCSTPELGKKWFITKAGGFGESGLLLDLAERFSRYSTIQR